MRKLVWFSVGFAAACGIGACMIAYHWFLPLVLLSALGFAGAWLAGKRWRSARYAAVILLGCTAGFAWFCAFQNFYLQPVIAVDGQTREITVTAREYSCETQYGSSVVGTVQIDGKSYRIKLYLDDTAEVCPGDILTGPFRLRYTAPGGAEDATFHPGKGIFLLGYQRGDAEYIPEPLENGRLYAAEIAFRVKSLLRDILPDSCFPFALALLLGDGSELDYAVDTAFKISGIRHIIAVSGLHVTILYSLIHNITLRRRVLSGLLTLPVLFVFAAVAGFTPSVTRACIMIGLMILSQIFDREYDSPTALAFASLVMLIGNPLVITSAGFQLSVGCVAGILLFQTPISNWLKRYLGNPKGRGIVPRLKRWLISSISVTVSAMSITTPLSAFYFDTVSLVGIVTNLLTLWTVNLIFSGLIAACLISFLSVPMAGILGRLLSVPIQYVLYVSDRLSQGAMAAVYTASVFTVLWLVFVYLLLAVFLAGKRKHPWVFVCCIVISLFLSQLLSYLEPMTDEVRMTVLDVGQGQSIILQSDGKTVLVDCGGDDAGQTADLIAGTLLSQGISSLDGIILTHTDADHAGALDNLLSRIDVKQILLPLPAGAVPELPLTQKQEEMAYWVKETVSVAYGNTSVTIYGPGFLTNSNENSLCVLFSRENCDILITGDRGFPGEVLLMEQAQLPQVDVLIVGHHGSRYSTSEELLDVIRPEVAIISVGSDNPYGHPAQEVLDRLYACGCRVYRTDEQGTIVFRR